MALKFRTSRAVAATSAPPIPRAQAWAKSYAPSFTRPLLNLSQGVPGDPPHPLLLSELAKTSSDPKSAGYGGILGEEKLRSGMVEEMREIYRWTKVEESSGGGVTLGNMGITSGCNQAFLTTMMALCDAGDEIILPCPWYFNILMTLQLLSLKPIPLAVSSENAFTPSVEAARKLITSKTKALILVSPNNPTGTILSPELIEEFFELCKERGIALILDETYRDFVRPVPASTSPEDGEDIRRGFPHSLYSRPDWKETMISLMSFSKSYKIPGHRLGGIVAGEDMLNESATVTDCMQICAPRPPQLALIPVLSSLRSDLITTSNRLHSRLQLFSKVISSVPGWSISSQGGFYSFVAHPYEGVPSEVVGEKLAKEVGVLTLPGAWFMPERGSEQWKMLEEQKSPLVEDKWIRFAIANVSDEVVGKLKERLLDLNKIMGYEG